MTPAEGHEQRGSPRVAHSIMVRYRCPERGEMQWGISPLRDLSVGGARFFSERPFSAGTALDLHLMLPVAKQPVVLTGRIAWARPGRLGMTELGVTFEPSDPDTRAKVELAVAHFLGKQGKG